MDERQRALGAGLYSQRFEHDSCGIGMIVDIKGRSTHQLVTDAIDILERLTHRGGVGYEPDTGDGAGILLQMPDAFMRRAARMSGFELPAGEKAYGVAMMFASPDAPRLAKTLARFSAVVKDQGLEVLGVRYVPVSAAAIGKTAASVRPSIVQVFIGRGCLELSDSGFERALYLVSKQAHNRIRNQEHDADPYFYLASCSASTIVYKGMLLPLQLSAFYLDLKDTELASAIALVHSRFSTNTFPSWERAHPMRHIIHNGEINTIRGNTNWVHAREASMASSAFGDDLSKAFPVVNEDGSDSAMLDDFLDILLNAGYSLHEAVMMTIPEPWEENPAMDPQIRAMYEYNSCLVEPWDGPASVAFTDGRFAGATLDRNGLRPSRYYVTADDQLILSSEVGVLPVAPEKVVRKDRLRPGRMLLIDTQAGRIIEDAELKRNAAAARPYRDWLSANMVELAGLALPGANLEDGVAAPAQDDVAGGTDDACGEGGEGGTCGSEEALLLQQKAFGYTWEDLSLTLAAIANKGEDPISAMGYDAPLAVLSKRPQLLYSYFKQLFAQVTNPPIDAIREHLVTSSMIHLGAEGNILEPSEANCRVISHDTPILTGDDMARLRACDLSGLRSVTIPILFRTDIPQGMQRALDAMFAAADSAREQGSAIIILSDKGADAELAPIPALLAVAGLHHHLIRHGTRTQISIVIESGEPREVHHHALLVGYGADAVYPYLAYESVAQLSRQGLVAHDEAKAKANYCAAVTNGIIKVMSKMGISTVRSYHGAQVFEALGLSTDVVNRFFTGTTTRIGGLILDDIEAEALARHREAFHPEARQDTLPSGGDYRWRNDGEEHLLNPKSIFYLQQAVRNDDYALFKKFSADINDRSKVYKNLRALLDIVTVEKPIPLEEVEPAQSIVRRFKTGAMSFGSISSEAHECMAIAMNRLGGKSNSGEGGEAPERFVPGADGTSRCSSIKQVASGRFGVTINYLNNCTEIQIKMAQGAKPGEGGHLPGTKVYPWVAKNRYSTPGVELISPPPHHDIYSIEDLAQLIHDLKNANRDARVNVKLVSEAGVGTIAVGAAKGLADVIVISGFDGGTGAASRTSIRHAGLPWELGVAETQQSLVANKLRDRVAIETDGKLFNGRDIIIAGLLGAEEFTLATAPLIAMGCDMMRVCNLDTCPVGIATQNPELRRKFQGKPEHVERLMLFIAEEVREWMARIGARCFDELVGHVELLMQIEVDPAEKAARVDLSRLLHQTRIESDYGLWHFSNPQDHKLASEADMLTLVPLCASAIDKGERLEYHLNINNRNRTFATLLSSEITRAKGEAGLPDDSIHLHLRGSGGQSFGAFLAPGVTLDLQGDTNDYLGKGMSGGRIVIRPPQGSTFEPSENIIVGNVAFYGATRGEAYLCGVAGERFCVRNSGVTAVIEGVGDHGCEYMTGGTTLVLGPVGRNFAAGMSGGIAYVLDEDGSLEANLNSGNVSAHALGQRDEAMILKLLARHVEYTGSPKAKLLLERFAETAERFVKILPNDYAKVLDALEEASARNLSHDESMFFAYHAVVDSKKKAV